MPGQRPGPDAMKRMVQLLQQGAVMLAETCPICGLPLFRLKSGEVVCPVHGRVVIVSSDEEEREVHIEEAVKLAEYRAALRVQEALERGEAEEVLRWLNVIEAAERIRGLRSQRARGRGQPASRPSQP
jgi:UPF0148 protein